VAYKIFAPVSLCLLLAGCGLFRKKPEGNEAPLIPRAVLFGNPEKGCVRISPDGLKLAYLAPCEGVLNIWVRTLGQQDDHPVTHDQKRGIREFVWAKNNTHLLFLQDTDGDENWHIYRADLKTLKIADLTPFPGVRARVLSVDKKFPDTVLVTLNKNNPTTLFDVYELDIPSGNLKLVAKNPGNIDVWLADSNLQVRAAVTVKPDGSTVLLVRDNPGSKWIQKQVWSLEDSLAGLYPPAGSRPISFSRDGKFLYLIDSAGANTQRLVKMGLETGAREVLAFDDQYDVHAVVCGQDTGEPELVSWERARTEWKVLRPELEQDLTRILAANTGDLISIDRSSDDTKWVLYFENDIAPGAYYLYDRKAREPVDATQDMLRLCKSTLRQAQGERLVGTALCKSTQAGVTTSTSLLPLILPVLRSNPSCEGGSETKSSRRTAGTAGRTGSCIDFLFYDRPELAKYQLAPTKPISFVARDGLIIHGYLTCPLGKEPQNLPLVLQVHGGPWSYRNIWGFSLPTNAEAQLFALSPIAQAYCMQETTQQRPEQISLQELMPLALKGDWPGVVRLCEQDGESTMQGMGGMTLLHVAWAQKNLGACWYLVAHGALNTPDFGVLLGQVPQEILVLSYFHTDRQSFNKTLEYYRLLGPSGYGILRRAAGAARSYGCHTAGGIITTMMNLMRFQELDKRSLRAAPIFPRVVSPEDLKQQPKTKGQ